MRVEPWPQGVGRHILDEVDSTNAHALRVASGDPGPAWLLARSQTQGRGRRGRAWLMPVGNFAATLLLRPAGGPAAASLLSFVAALALHDALAAVCGPQARLAIKWPNDVLLNERKVAGILLESGAAHALPGALAVGIGVNLIAAPMAEDLEPGAVPPICVADATGHHVTPEDFLDLLAPAFSRWQGQLATWGFAPIRTAWLARAARLGETVTARTGTAETIGRFEGIDDSGALILTTAAGRQTLAAADIFFGGQG